jgi:hypothetical protein
MTVPVTIGGSVYGITLRALYSLYILSNPTSLQIRKLKNKEVRYFPLALLASLEEARKRTQCVLRIP